MGKVPAFEIAAKLVLDVLRKRTLVRFACMLQEFRQVLTHKAVEHGLLRTARRVGSSET